MKSLLELGADCNCSNLPTTNKVAIIIPDKYQQYRFCDIFLLYQSPENNNNQYHTMDSNSATYMLYHYILIFPHKDLSWH